MSTTKNLRLARIVKKLLDIIFGLLVFVCIVLVIWIALTPLLASDSGSIGTASVPVRISTGVMFSDKPAEGINAAFVEEAEGVLRLETRSFNLVLLANGAKLIAAIGLTYVFYLLRSLAKAVLEGEPFTSKTSLAMRRLGYTVLIVGILKPAVEYLASVAVLSRLPSSSPPLNPGPSFNNEVILATLLILLLAHIWSYALDLEQERALTI